MSKKPKFRLGREKGKPNWYVKWTENTKPKRISTGTENEAEAKQFFDQFVNGWDAPEAGKDVTIMYAIESYLEFKEQVYLANNAPARNLKELGYTLEAVKAKLKGFTIPELTRQRVRAITKEWQDEKISNGTIRKRFNILGAAINHVRKEGHINITPHIDKPESPPARDKFMTKEQVKKFVNGIKLPHLKLFTLLGLYTLSRKQAILDLKWDRVTFHPNYVQIDFNVPGRHRTGKRRANVTVTSKMLIKLLKEAKEFAETDYVIEYNGHGGGTISVAFRRYAKRIKMNWVTPHILRHTGACLMAQEGVDMFEIAGIMGDNVMTVQKHYLKHSPKHLQKAAKTLERIYG